MTNDLPPGEVVSVGAFYVCDSCGSIEVRDVIAEGDEWTCNACGSSAAWEFPPDRRPHAEEHAAHIARIAASPLFRKVTT